MNSLDKRDTKVAVAMWGSHTVRGGGKLGGGDVGLPLVPGAGRHAHASRAHLSDSPGLFTFRDTSGYAPPRTPLKAVPIFHWSLGATRCRWASKTRRAQANSSSPWLPSRARRCRARSLWCNVQCCCPPRARRRVAWGSLVGWLAWPRATKSETRRLHGYIAELRTPNREQRHPRGAPAILIRDL